jgi:hypothetical protein
LREVKPDITEKIFPVANADEAFHNDKRTIHVNGRRQREFPTREVMKPQPRLATQGTEFPWALTEKFPNIGPLLSRWELDKFKNCRIKSFRTSKILALLYQKFLNLLISQRDMSGPRLEALSNNR